MSRIMDRKRPIDRQREAAVTLIVGDEDDKSGIKEFLSTQTALYVIKDNGLYKVQLADDIDPQRTNPNIPNLSQKILSFGYNDEVVARILLTAKYLFDEHNATVRPFIGSLLETSIDVTRHIVELRQMVSDLQDDIAKRENKSKEDQLHNAFSLPSIPDISARIHNILVKADKTKDAILGIYKLQFLPNIEGRPLLSEYDKAMEILSEKAPQLISAWEETKKFFVFVRNARNSSEHPKDGQRIVLSNFSMTTEGGIVPPLIEVVHKDTPIRTLPLSEFIQFIFDVSFGHAESSLLHIKYTTLLDNNPFGEWVAEFSPEDRRHPMVRYYRSININGIDRILG